MQITLRLPDPSLIRLMTREYDDELDDVRSILWDGCSSIGANGEFVVSGYRLNCSSLGSWQPNPSVERMSYGDVAMMFGRVMDEFVAFLKQVSPEAANHPWVRDWMK